ncbi:hypothetical protein Syun_005425 [Stephania yunnanensis]|uniref:Myb/SANT-like domain-containing protein n=1 Tax=Stephania yunnanensis TaxID=152371 RepID=A0AAP0L670_9MAGN
MASPANRSVKSSDKKPKQEIPRAKWTMYLSKILADLMVEQALIGNKQKKSFSKKAWRYMLEEFHRKTGLKWDKDQLKNRYGVLRRHYTIVKSLLEREDFTWDESRRMVVANDQVWDEYIKVHPDAEVIRTNGCPIYRQLCIIFSDTKANGNNENLNDLIDLERENSLLLTSPKVASMPIDCGGQSTFAQEDSSSSTEDDDDEANEQTKFQIPTQPGSDHHKRKRALLVNDAMAKAILDMAAASKQRAAMASQGSDRFSITNCIKALDEMQEVDDHIYYVALDLFESANARETFLSLKMNRRLIWLKSKCSSPSSSALV